MLGNPVELITTSIICTAIFSAAVWLLKVSIEKAITRSADLTIKKAEAAANKEIEIIRAGLKVSEITRQISYPEVFKRQLDLIDKLYNNLLEFHQLSVIAVNGMYDNAKENEFRDNYYKAMHKLKDSFYRTAIYLPKSLAERYEQLFRDIKDVTHQNIMVEIEICRPEKSDMWNKLWENKTKIISKVNDEIPPLIDQLRDHIRRVLNIDDVA